ncbi:MAG: hypothetical protein QM479_05365 [Pseudomonadota bacterium]
MKVQAYNLFKRTPLSQSILSLGVAGKMAMATPGISNAETIRVDVNNVGEGAVAYASAFHVDISKDGNVIAFISNGTDLVTTPADTNRRYDVFIYNKTTQTTKMVSVDSSGNQLANGGQEPSVSADGRYIAFLSYDSNNSQYAVYLHDALTGNTSLVSLTETGSIPNNSSYRPQISANGNAVVFTSGATDLVANDTNGVTDTFIRDLVNQTTKRLSVNSSGAEGNDGSYNPSISDNGLYVAYQSNANNLVLGDTNNEADIFVVNTSTTIKPVRVSINSAGDEANDSSYYPSISGDGNFIAFLTDANNLVAGDTNSNGDIIVVNNSTITQPVRVNLNTDGSQANAYSYYPDLSTDGRHISFASEATNLVNNDNNNTTDAFVHDKNTGITTRVSVDSNGAETNQQSGLIRISGNGQDIAYLSADSPSFNHSDAFVYSSGQKIRVHNNTQGNYPQTSPSHSITSNSSSADGRYIVFSSNAFNLLASNMNEGTNIFLRDTLTNTTKLINSATDGSKADNHSSHSSISSDGRYILFESDATNLVANDTNNTRDIFRYDTNTQEIIRVSMATGGVIESNGNSENPSMSSDGRYIIFKSVASNLVANDTNGSPVKDVFVYDTVTKNTNRVSVNSNGDQGTGGKSNNFIYGDSPSVSLNGDIFVFSSRYTNLVNNDNNNVSDIFIHIKSTGETRRISVDANGGEANNVSGYPIISPDANYITFQSDASNLVSSDTNSTSDIFLLNRTTGLITRVSVDSNGLQANGSSFSPSISDDGQFISFTSYASNLVANDTDYDQDIFVHNIQTGETRLMSLDNQNTQFTDVGRSALSGDAQSITYIAASVNSEYSGIYRSSPVRVLDTPDDFSFTDQSNVSLSSAITSNAITVSGINTSISISISNGSYEINNSGNWSSSTASVNNGDTI